MLIGFFLTAAITGFVELALAGTGGGTAGTTGGGTGGTAGGAGGAAGGAGTAAGNNTWLWILIAVLVIAAAIWFFRRRNRPL
jgi:LPXTG-motif cell wall-anchored protein